jgi:DNA polymerase-3 subunit delta'
VPLLPLIGHARIRQRMCDAIARGSLPASLLLHGPRGAGKERLALWIGTRLLCVTPSADGEPCGTCRHCQYVAGGVHPDLHWYFPRPKLKDAKPDDDDVASDMAEAIEERLNKKSGVWPAHGATDAIYLPTHSCGAPY